MSRRESSIEGACADYAKSRDCWAVKQLSNIVGFPDREVLCPGGRSFFAELKTSEGRLSPRQRHVHTQLRGLGFLVAVPRSVEEFKQTLDTFLLARSVKPEWFAQALNRRAAVEQQLLDIYHGKRPPPQSLDAFRDWALELGVPEEYRR